MKNRVALAFQTVFRTILGTIIFSQGAFGILDLNGDKVSELMSSSHPGVVFDQTDTDGDGVSNFVEGLAGTNPRDEADRFEIGSIGRTSDEISFSWSSIPGKRYAFQKWNSEDGSWTECGVANPTFASEERVLILPGSNESGIFRLSVSDIDADLDGLSAWEEYLLGWSDSDAMSSGSPDRSDYVAAIRALESPSGVQLAGGEIIPQRLPTEAEASRFLVQASFGPSKESIEELAQVGMGAWIDSQLALPASKTETTMFQNHRIWDAYIWRHGWLRSSVLSEDQLRQRLAYALSQILVVNTQPGSNPGDNGQTQARHYDLLVTDAFSSYRNVLEKVTYSPVMGHYLSHLQNRKADESLNRFPDENFAREVMQLFTIGLWKLNNDGTHQKDPEGELIPTYDNDVITETAKIFTGFSFSTADYGARPAEGFFDTYRGLDYQNPLKVWDEEHSPGAKVIVDGHVIPDGQTGKQDVQQTLDILCDHQNMRPFISRLLIQRFTTSNPSPAYIARVVGVWGDDTELDTVVEAILLDPEARVPDGQSAHHGKVREPLIRFIHLLRAFNFEAPNDTFLEGGLIGTFGQYPHLSPTVFNFYSPDYSPQGELRDQNLVSPELEIGTLSNLIATDNFFYRALLGLYAGLVPDFQDEIDLSEDPDGLIEHLNLILGYGQLPIHSKVAIREAVVAQTTATERVRTAVYLILNSPSFSTIK